MATVQSYLELARQLEKELSTAKPGDLVESETLLARRFGVSRLTARAALQELERLHLVRRKQGTGTFVTRRIDYRVSDDGPASFTEIVRAAGGDPTTTNEGLVSRVATAMEREVLDLSSRARVIELHRRRWLDGAPVWVGSSVMPAALVPNFARRFSDGGSLFHLLNDVYGLAPRRSWYRYEFGTAPPGIAGQLGLRGRPELFHHQGRLVSEKTGTPVEMNEGWFRADVFNVVIEFGNSRRCR